MEGIPALYQGRILSQMDKSKFRAFIYGLNNIKKLVNSWEEFENHMSTGLWFSTIEEINAQIPQEVVLDAKKNDSKSRRIK